MLVEALVVVLLIVWLIGVILGQTFGGLLHALFFLAAVIFIFRLLSDRTVA